MDATSERIGRYVLDRRLGFLRDGAGTAVHLRPKSYRLLEALSDRRGELVTKDALAEAVWGNVAVTDESLSQCISDVRRVLGKDGARLLRTVPRRGYVLDPEPSASAHNGRRPQPAWFAGVPAALIAAGFLAVNLAGDPASGPAVADGSGNSAVAAPGPAAAVESYDWRDRRSNDARRVALRAALVDDPTDAAAWCDLGLTYWLEVTHVAWGGGRRELNLALDALERSLRLGGTAKAYRVLAEIRLGAPFEDARSPVDALAAARAAVDLAPDDPESLATLAAALLANGYVPEAVLYVERAMARVATPPDRFREIAGIAYLLAGEPGKAVEELGRVHGAGTFGGTRSYAGWYLAASLAHAGRIDDASSVIDKARRTRPDRTLESVALSLDRLPDQQSRKIVLDGLKLAGMPN